VISNTIVAVQTTVLLIRHGVTDWHREGRLLGHRDIGLNADGINQSHAAAKALRDLPTAEILTSPLVRAVQTAEIVAGQFDLEVARDPRLTDLNPGMWEGKAWADIADSPEYKKFLADPLAESIPGGGDSLISAQTRAVRSVEQALGDNPTGSCILVVSHAAPIRLLLAHYLGMHVASYHRLTVQPGSISVLRVSSDFDLPRVLGVNLHEDVRPVLAPR